MNELRPTLYALALFEAGLCVLAALGQAIAAGTPLYLVPGLSIATLFIVAAVSVPAGRRWGLVTLLVLDGVRLSGFLLSATLGLLPWVQLPVTGATVADGLILPAIVVTLSARLLSATPIPVGAVRG
jgi:hypothetical protein